MLVFFERSMSWIWVGLRLKSGSCFSQTNPFWYVFDIYSEWKKNHYTCKWYTIIISWLYIAYGKIKPECIVDYSI